MMREPTRLRLDPDQPPGLREALDAEIERPLGHDLGAMKAQLSAEIAAGASSSASATIAPKMLAVLVALGTAGAWWWTRTDEPPAPSLDAPAIARDAPRTAPRLTRLEPPIPATPSEPAATRTRPSAAPAVEPRPETPETIETPEASELAVELAMYAEAEQALQAREHVRAAKAFARYLEAYPSGRLEVEATIGALEAWHRARSPDRVVSLAVRVLDDARFSVRHPEVLRVMAEAEVMRGRCVAAERAYRRALDAGAALERDDVRAALDACERRTMR